MTASPDQRWLGKNDVRVHGARGRGGRGLRTVDGVHPCNTVELLSCRRERERDFRNYQFVGRVRTWTCRVQGR